MTLTCPSGATLTEAEAFLDAHPEIEAFDIVLHDSTGSGAARSSGDTSFCRSTSPGATCRFPSSGWISAARMCTKPG